MSIDNSDGRQQISTTAHTTHYTNGTVFHVEDDSEETEREEIQDERRVCDKEITVE